MTNLLPRLEFALQSLYRRGIRCPHCRSDETRRIARKHVTIRVRRCERCALCFTDPLYESSVFGRLYDSAYAGEGSTTRLPNRAELETRKRELFAGTDKDARARLVALRDLAPGPRFLELGSSWGYVVYQALALGFDAEGVEIGRARREFGVRELGVVLHESLADLGDRRFDLIYSAHVLEHFTDLSTIFDELEARLAPGGLLAIEVPHFDLEGRGDAALANVGAVHPLGFTPAFFARNLSRHGLGLEAFYDAWEDVPERSVPASAGDVVIVLARKPPRGRTEG